MKKALTFGIMALVIAIIAVGTVGAVSVTNVLSPQGTLTSSRTTDFQFTLDEEPVGCWIEIGLTNGTTLGNHSAGEIGTTKSGKQYTNSSYAIPIDSNVSGQHNWSIYCGATAASSTLVDTKFFNVRVATPTAVNPTSGQVKDSKTFTLQATVPVEINTTAGYVCQYRLYNGSWTSWADLATSDNLTWSNSSAFTTNVDSGAGAYHNISYRCNDTTGLYEGENIYFKVDSTAPSYTMGNLSRSSSTATYKAAVTDNTALTCTATVYDRTGASAATLTGTSEGTGSSKNCTYTLTGDQIGSDGSYNIEATVVDEASNSATKSNKSGVLQTLYAGWNLISWSDASANLSTICSGISGCSSASWFNNTAKTFTTYSTATPSVNAGTDIAIGENLLVYVTGTTYLLMDDHYSSVSAENQSIYVGWNLFSLTQNASLNTTLYAHANITWASTYDQSAGTFYTCSKATGTCAGTSSGPASINLEKGTSAWVLTTLNASINRTGVSG